MTGERAQTVQAALKAGANPEQATDAARAKREEVQAKKDKARSGLRFGFQLAEEPDLEELVIDRPIAVEVKYDGHLALLVDGKIVNRSGRDVTNRFPEIEKIDGPAVLLGELIIPDEKGLGDFSGGIQTRNTDDEMKIRALSQQRPAMFVAFDILEVAGEDVTRLSARQRRILLEGVYEGFDKIVGTAPRRHQLIKQELVNSKADVLRLLERERARGGEGLMLKVLEAPYVAKPGSETRGRNWMKLKTWSDRVFDIVKHGPSGVGPGYTITIRNKGREQIVNLGSYAMRKQIQAGHRRVEIKFLSEGDDGALRFPSVRKIV
jgi:ATP-dependent DNA ligase